MIKGSLEISQNSQETTTSNFIKKGTLAQVFSCEFCEISKGTFFTEHLLTTASGFLVNLEKIKHGKVGFITKIILNKKYKRSD